MKRDDKLKVVYEFAKEFLYYNTPEEIGTKGLTKYFDVKKKFTELNDVLYQLLYSLQNTQMMPNVIGLEKTDRVDKFNNILFGYDCDKILQKYTPDSLLESFTQNFEIRNLNSKQNLWRRYAKSIISAAEFMRRFESAKDFDIFVMRFTYNELSAAALPMLLSREIYGMGFTLSCDFLKELGYSEYPKPDTHIKDILNGLELCEHDDYDSYKTMIEMAKINYDTPYNVDKILWLIGSGRYYLHNVLNGRKKEEFISLASERLMNM